MACAAQTGPIPGWASSCGATIATDAASSFLFAASARIAEDARLRPPGDRSGKTDAAEGPLVSPTPWLRVPSSATSTRGPGACSPIHANAAANPAASLGISIVASGAPAATRAPGCACRCGCPHRLSRRRARRLRPSVSPFLSGEPSSSALTGNTGRHICDGSRDSSRTGF